MGPTDLNESSSTGNYGAAPLRLTTLGALRLVSSGPDGEAVALEGANKTLALFTYLACSPGRGATRSHLQELLWERQTPEGAQQSLRTYLWKLRKLLPADAITGEEFLMLNIAFESDRDALVDAANRGDANDVVARYTGEFFPSYTQPDSPQFDAWVQGERLRLRGIYSRCVERVVASAIDSGHFREAIDVARGLRDSDPLDEAAWRPLLNSLLVSGDSVNAANESAVLTRTLAADGREPLPATGSVLNAIARMSRRDEAPAAELNQFVTPLIARDREFSQLLASWTRARDGALSHVHVRGAAGMGKSRLLDDFATRLQRERAAVTRARADIGRRSLSYAFVGTLAAQLATRRGAAAISPGSMSALLAINPSLSSFLNGHPDTATGDEALRRRTLAFSELLTVLSEEQPLAVLLDDVQWADSASCAVLAGALASSDTISCLLVTAARDDLGPAFINSRLDAIALSGLGIESVTELLQSLATLPEEPWAAALPQMLHDASAGLPLHMFDALRLATERHILTRERQAWHCADPATLAHLLESGAALPRRIGMLSEAEREVLLQLAVAGEPCEEVLLGQALVADASPRSTTLSRLERLGYVTMDEDRWCIAHDAVTDAVIALGTDSEAQRAHESLARHLLAALPAPIDLAARVTLRKAIGHALLAREPRLLADAFSRHITLARKLKDTRALPDIAADALGDLNSTENRARLIGSLPRRTRLTDVATTRWKPAATITAIAIAASLVGAFVATRPDPAVTDGFLGLMRTDSNGRTTVSELALSSADWPVDRALETNGARVVMTLPGDASLGDAVPTGARGREWIGTLSQADSGTTDLVLFQRDRAPRRLTFARGDDLAPSMSPDGQRVAFASARWSAVADRSIAILDLRTGTVTRLTQPDGSDETPIWSPDGRRIAFTRRGADSIRLCVVNLDGRSLVCPIQPPRHSSVRANAWIDDSVLVGTIESRYVRMHVDSGSVTVLDSVPGSRLVSPDGRWLATVRDGVRTGDAGTCEVAPALEPSRRRMVRFSSTITSPCLPVTWTHARADGRFVERIAVDTVSVGPYVNVPYTLTARAIRSGDTSIADHVQWSTSDSAFATIDTSGVLQPRRVGMVTVFVSYGGWRSDSVTLTIAESYARAVLREDWRAPLTDRWTPFGEPKPRVVTFSDSSRALLNNGDGEFHSGVHSRASFPVDSGLTLDTWVSVPVTMDRWQVVRVGLFTNIDSAGLARWNHKDGWTFSPGREAHGACEFQYPSGPEGMRSFAERFQTAKHQLAAPSGWAKGERIRVMLQLFPDGRCGAAVNGRVVGFADAPANVHATRAHVFLYGNSPGTMAVVGPLVVSVGVAGGIEWRDRVGVRAPSPKTATPASRSR